MNIVLVGMMGSGKSAVGRILSAELGWDFYDSDKWIEKKQQKTIAQIFEENGEDYFRHLEQNALHHLCSLPQAVISTGGGAPCFQENWKFLQESAWVVWLKASADTLWKRLQRSPARQRPLIAKNDIEEFKTLLTGREEFYSHAHAVIETDQLEVKEVIEKIKTILPPEILKWTLYLLTFHLDLTRFV